MRYSFHAFDLDTDRIELRRDGEAVHIEPQVFDVLRYLIEHRDRVISKIELFEQVWGGAFVGESTLTSRIKTARQLLGDDGQAQRMIRTVHRRGYQFVADVVEDSGGRDPARNVVTPAEDRPTGTITFLFSDIEGSSALWERHPDLMADVVAEHDRILASCITGSSGVIFSTGGDGVAAAFARATDAVTAAGTIRSSLDEAAWPAPIDLRVRLGLHSGEAVERSGDYLGPTVNRAARVAGAARGGQTLVSDATAMLVGERDDLSDLGVCRIDPAMPATRLWQLGPGDHPPLAGTAVVTPPTLRTELIGRAEVLERLRDSIERERLVSIVGPGGAGKTTLSLAVANELLGSFADGVVFAELASVVDATGIVRAVAEAAGVEGRVGHEVRTLAAHLAARSTMVVLDNCEHLLDECADVVDALLDAGSEVVIVATSREPLGVDGELVVPIGSLDDDAATLFVARAQASRPEIEIEPDDPRIVELCGQLDGLPLAIELAAAQLGHLRLDDLVGRLGSVLELSRQGRTRGRARHATLEHTIAWSYDLLDDRGRHLIRQLGVLPGTFDLETAREVGASDGADVVRGLADLVAKNLLTWNPATGRYRLLETIRAFAAQRLLDADEFDDAGERLRCAVVARAQSRSRTDRWLSGEHAVLVRADADNQRFGFERSMWAGHVTDALEIHIGSSQLFRNTIGCGDGRRWAAHLDAVADELSPRDRLWALLIRADIAQGTADHELGLESAAAALALSGEVDDVGAEVLARQFAALHHIVSSPPSARAELQDARQLAGVVDARLVHLLDAFIAMTDLSAGRIEAGTELAESVADAASGDGYEMFIANWSAWTAALINGDAVRLRHWRERQHAYLTRLGLPEPWMFLWSSALVTAMEGGDATAGLRVTRDRAASEGHDITDDIVLALAIVERLAGRHETAAELLGLAASGRLNNLSHYVLVRTTRAELDAELGRDTCRAAMRRGATGDPKTALAERGIA